jgi:hypothetical protein
MGVDLRFERGWRGLGERRGSRWRWPTSSSSWQSWSRVEVRPGRRLANLLPATDHCLDRFDFTAKAALGKWTREWVAGLRGLVSGAAPASRVCYDMPARSR